MLTLSRRAVFAANTALRDSVSTVALHVCFVCTCLLPVYFRFNLNYPLITRKSIICLAHTVSPREGYTYPMYVLTIRNFSLNSNAEGH